MGMSRLLFGARFAVVDFPGRRHRSATVAFRESSVLSQSETRLEEIVCNREPL